MLSTLKKDGKQDAIPVLDGVRAIACLSVIAYHVNRYTALTYVWKPSFVGKLLSAIAMDGWSGVTLFFILSGFLLFRPYIKALLFDGTWPAARLFYLRRALRILPGYYVSLFLLILFTQPQYLRPDHLLDLGLFLTFLMDSSHATYQMINGPFWTLAVEWQFYLLLPLLAWGFHRVVRRGSLRRRTWLLILCLLGMIAWGLATRYWGRYYSLHPAETSFLPRPLFDAAMFVFYGQTGKFLEDFAIGMLISVCYVLLQYAYSTQKVSIQRIHTLSFWLWGVGIVWLFFMGVWYMYTSWLFLDPYIGAHNWLCEIGLALGYGLCVMAVLFGPATLKLPFVWGPLRWIGLISYSLYIWHLPLLNFFIAYILPHLYGHRNSLIYASYWLFVVLVIMPFASLFYHLVELPWIRVANRTRKKAEVS